MAGIVTLNGSNPEFEVCGGGTRRPVTGPAVPDLLALQRGLTPGEDSGVPIFVDLLARIEPPTSGSDAGTDAGLRAMEIRRAAFEGFGCRTVDGDLLARGGGNEPFWSVEVHRDHATFSTPEGDLTLEAGPLERANGAWRVTGTAAGGGTFEFTLDPGGCTDSMSGAWSHARATFTHESGTYTGCGFLGAAGEPTSLSYGFPRVRPKNSAMAAIDRSR
jgi:uncharacterized membrane protein